MPAGAVVILNGAPRAGKTRIAAALQADRDVLWINLGVDAMAVMTPAHLRPGIGLRPGGERPDLEPHLPALFFALYDAVAALARGGAHVAVDIGHHDDYARPLGLLPQCARRLAGLPVLFVGVRCPIEEIMRRRAASGAGYETAPPGAPIPAPVLRWQEAVHAHGLYDLELDTAALSPDACADAIRARLAHPADAFARLAARA